MATTNLTLTTNLAEVLRKDIHTHQALLQKNYELEMLAELKRASRQNYVNRTGRLWRTQRRIPGVGVRIGSRYAPYWQWIDNKTRGSGQFARELFRPRFVREAVFSRAVARTNREMRGAR